MREGDVVKGEVEAVGAGVEKSGAESDGEVGGLGALPLPQNSKPLLWSKDMKGLWGGF
jgi:hypothetical protein